MGAAEGGAEVTAAIGRLVIVDAHGCVHVGEGVWSTVRDDAETYASETSAGAILEALHHAEPFRDAHVEPVDVFCVTPGCACRTAGALLCPRCLEARPTDGGP
jgi:hypothetical protein